MSIGSDRDRPHLWIIAPDSAVVVQIVGQVIGNQVFARRSHVDRVPVMELAPHPVHQLALGLELLGQRRVFEKNEIPKLVAQLLGLQVP